MLSTLMRMQSIAVDVSLDCALIFAFTVTEKKALLVLFDRVNYSQKAPTCERSHIDQVNDRKVHAVHFLTILLKMVILFDAV